MDEEESGLSKAKETTGKAADTMGKVASAPKDAAKVAERAAKISEKLGKANHLKASQAVGKVAAGAQKVAAISQTILGILGWILLVLLIIIAVIGLVTFLISGIGMVFNGIKQISHKVANYWTRITSGEEYIVEIDQMQDVMNYLVGMNYDLYDYGFVEELPGYSYTINENKQTDDDGNELDTESSAGTVILNEENYKRDIKSESEPSLMEKIFVGNWNQATKPNPYRYLTAYLVSDNYGSIIKNNNHNWNQMFHGTNNPWKNFFEGFADNTKWRFRFNLCLL